MPLPLEVVAHRGYALHFPENTLVALQAAVNAGARYVEIDVQLTRDGIPVLFHDEELSRLCGVSGSLSEQTLAALAPLRASEPHRFGNRFADEPIATLQQFCLWLMQRPAVTAFVEIKPEAIRAHGHDSILRAIMPALVPVHSQCVIISFDHDFLLHFRQRQPGFAIGAVVDRWSDLATAAVDNLRAEYMFCDVQGLPPQGELVAPHGARVVIYEVADISLALSLAARGVRMFESFACGELLRSIAGC